MATETSNIKPNPPPKDPLPVGHPLPAVIPKVMEARPIKPAIKQVNERLEAKGIKQTPVRRKVETPPVRRASKERSLLTPFGFVDINAILDPNRPLTPLPPSQDVMKREMVKELKPFNPDLPIRGWGTMLVNSPLPFAEAKSPPPPPPPPPRITEMSDELSLNIFETKRVDVGPKSGVVKTRTGDTKTMLFEDEKFVADGGKAIEESEEKKKLEIMDADEDVDIGIGIVIGNECTELEEKRKLVEGGTLKTKLQYIVKEGEEVEVTIKPQELEPDELVIVEVPKKKTLEGTKSESKADEEHSNSQNVEFSISLNKKSSEKQSSTKQQSASEMKETPSEVKETPTIFQSTKKDTQSSSQKEVSTASRKEPQSSTQNEVISKNESQSSTKKESTASSTSRKQSKDSVHKETTTASRKQSTSSHKVQEDTDSPYEKIPVKDLIDSFENCTRPIMRPKNEEERIPTPSTREQLEDSLEDASRQTQFVSYSTQSQQPFKPSVQPLQQTSSSSSSEPVVLTQQHFETSQSQQGQQKTQSFHYQSQQVVLKQNSQTQPSTLSTFQPISHTTVPADDQQFYVANTKVETRTFPNPVVSENTESLEESSFTISKKTTSSQGSSFATKSKCYVFRTCMMACNRPSFYVYVKEMEIICLALFSLSILNLNCMMIHIVMCNLFVLCLVF